MTEHVAGEGELWRCVPTCCGNCESRTLKLHCKAPSCPWRVCEKCEAITGFIKLQGRFKRRHFGGIP